MEKIYSFLRWEFKKQKQQQQKTNQLAKKKNKILKKPQMNRKMHVLPIDELKIL